MGFYGIRTDLALESSEKFRTDQIEIEGVSVEESYDEKADVRTTRVVIENEEAAGRMEKPVGNYITIEAPGMAIPDQGYHREISKVIAKHIRHLLPHGKDKSFLVIGLGNEKITPDALGPQVIRNLKITRHVIREYGQQEIEPEHCRMISALIPGVMAQTGMETLEIVKGVLAETKPDAIIAIDALAARSLKRLNCTVQITDTGISPGSGVGNHRRGLNKDTLGIPVIGIGVPTVVDAATIIHDSMQQILASLDKEDAEEFMDDLITPQLRAMFVTPKEIDETIKRLSFTISEGLNISFSNEEIQIS